MPFAEKEFVLTHVFKDVSSMEEGVYVWSNEEEHFGVPWRMCIHRKNACLGFHVKCNHLGSGEWSIEQLRDARILAATGKKHSRTTDRTFKSADEFDNLGGWDEFMRWDEFMENYVIDDAVTAEIHVTIRKMTGIPEKKKLRNFDESKKQYSDVVLVVGDEKFHVLKMYLATHSTYFEALFLRDFEESNQSEVVLQDVKPEHFQNFLELIYGESPINDSTIEGIVHLADMYDAKTAIQKCEQFLIEISEKTWKKKLELAHRCNLRNLKNYCLTKITTVPDIRSVLTNDLIDMDPSVLGALLRKALALHQI